MLKRLKTLLNEKVSWLLLIIFFAAIGFIITFFSFRTGIDFGDGSTFYSFARNVAEGEVIYKDFIHFRTPGSYFLFSGAILLLGDVYSSLNFAIGFESKVLYTAIFLLAVGIFLKFKKPIIGFITGALIIFLPAIAQLRTAFAFLAVSLYIHARDSKYKGRWLVVAGVAAGLSFSFGQEAGLIAVLTLVLAELVIETRSLKQLFKVVLPSLLKMAGGFLLGVLPLLVYVTTASDVGNFLYYTIYYAFILQPQSMDLTFPVLSYETSIFYLVLVAYGMLFAVTYFIKKRDWALTILLGFVIFRSITLLGRTDFPHLIFVLPELFFILIYALTRLKEIVFSKRVAIGFIIPLVCFILSITLAVNVSTFFIAAAVLTVLLAMRYRQEMLIGEATHRLPMIQAATFLVAAILTILTFWMYPSYKATYDGMDKDGPGAVSISGSAVDIPTKQQVDAVKTAIDRHDPQTIFAFPIQAYYYSLAPNHATRFMTFEPQTTKEEQRQTISDLKRTNPEVIIFDPLQAESLEHAVGDITSYIKRYYKTDTVVNITRELWVMIPKN